MVSGGDAGGREAGPDGVVSSSPPVVSNGWCPDKQPLVEPIHQTSAYTFDDPVLADEAFAQGEALYARDGLPNVRALERAVAKLEGAEEAIAVASGMAALATTCLTLLRSGDHVLVGHDGYCDTSALLEDLAGRFGIVVSRVDLNDPAAVSAAMTPATRLVLAETISNPGMRLLDLPTIAAITRPRGITLVVDNTFATPVHCQPLAWGADAVVHSAGKFLAGHGDITAGIVAGSTTFIESLKRSAYLYGPLLSPMEAWLTSRGMRTLGPRVMWASQSAARIAGWLQTHPAVESVQYVGLPSHDQVDLVRQLLPTGCGSVFTFRLRRKGVAVDFLRQLQAIPYAPTVGGLTTIASFPPRSQQLRGPGGPALLPYRSETIRLSIGLEETAELVADLDAALTGIAAQANADIGSNG